MWSELKCGVRSSVTLLPPLNTLGGRALEEALTWNETDLQLVQPVECRGSDHQPVLG